MRIARSTPEIKSQYVDVCVDVSKSKLDAYCEVGETAYEDQFSNAVRQIESALRKFDTLAKDAGKEGLRVSHSLLVSRLTHPCAGCNVFDHVPSVLNLFSEDVCFFEVFF